jgi:hypothetical protein
MQVPLDEGFLDVDLAGEELVEGLVAVLVHVHGSFDSGELPEGGALALAGEGELAALVEDAPDDHGEGGCYPALGEGFGVQGGVEADVPGEGEEGGAGPVFAASQESDGVGVSRRDGLALECGLDVEEGFERQAAEASVRGVLDFAVRRITEGGAQESDGGLGVAPLDFKVDGEFCFNGHDNCQ